MEDKNFQLDPEAKNEYEQLVMINYIFKLIIPLVEIEEFDDKRK